MKIEDFERYLDDAARVFAERIAEDIYNYDPASFVGPKMPPLEPWNDPDYELDLGFPHTWMPKKGTKAWRKAMGEQYWWAP